MVAMEIIFVIKSCECGTLIVVSVNGSKGLILMKVWQRFPVSFSICVWWFFSHKDFESMISNDL